MNSLTTTSRSSKGNSSNSRMATTTGSWASVSVVHKRWGRAEASSVLARLRHLATVWR